MSKKYFYSGYGVDRNGKQSSWHDGEYETTTIFNLNIFKELFLKSLDSDAFANVVDIHVISLCLIDDNSILRGEEK